MNIKLISASLIGVSSVGGAIAGALYLFNRDNNKLEKNTNPQTLPNQSPASPQTNLPSASDSTQPRG